MKWRFVIAWIPGIPIAIANGFLREMVYTQMMNGLHAHQLSAASFIVLFGAYVWLILLWLKPESGPEAVRIGLLWLVLTVVFEFGFGHYVMGHPWQHLFHDYNIAAGRLWVIVLFWIAASPWILNRLLKRRTHAE